MENNIYEAVREPEQKSEVKVLLRIGGRRDSIEFMNNFTVVCKKLVAVNKQLEIRITMDNNDLPLVNATWVELLRESDEGWQKTKIDETKYIQREKLNDILEKLRRIRTIETTIDDPDKRTIAYCRL